MTSLKSYSIAVGSLFLTAFAFYSNWQIQAENHRLSLIVVTNEQREKLLNAEAKIQDDMIADIKDQLLEAKRAPTYEQGRKDAIIAMGAGKEGGSFREGWEAALQTIDYSSYADGYHAAVSQFGYTQTANMKWLVPEPSIDQKKEGIQTKVDKK